MTLISKQYLKQNRKLHKKSKGYGSSGYVWAPVVLHMMRDNGCKNVLDYGAGKGTLGVTLGDFVQNYDPVTFPLDPKPADLLVCLDVLEHIEPEMLDAVLAHMRSLMKVCGLLTICTRPAQKNLPDGRNAHLIVEQEDWWVARLTGAGFIVRIMETDHPDTLLVEVR